MRFREDDLIRSVSRLKPRLGDYDVALAYFRAADYSSCLNELSHSENRRSTLLRCRALLRIGQAESAIDGLQAIKAIGSGSDAEMAQIEVLSATANAVLGHLGDAEKSLINARAYGFPTSSGALEGEIQFISSLVSRKNGAEKLSEKFIDAILAIEEDPSPLTSRRSVESYPFSAGYWKARAFESRALGIEVTADTSSQAKFFIRALTEFDRGAVEDRFIEASILYNATVLMRECGHRELTEFATSRATAFPWVPGVSFFEFFVFHNFGLRCAYEGDHISALRNFRRSAEVAPSTPLRLLAILDRCALTFELGESLSFAEELDYALRLSGQVDWNATTTFERRALLGLASVLANVDVMRARSLFNKYSGGTAAIWEVMTPLESKKARATYWYAESKVLFAEGQKSMAISALLNSYNACNEVGYNRLKAIAALDLWENTGELEFGDIVRREAGRYRNSIIARRLRASIGNEEPKIVR